MHNVKEAARLIRPGVDPASHDAKVSDEYLKPVFHEFFNLLRETNQMPKKRFHELVTYIPDAELDPEIEEKLDLIAAAYAGVTDTGTDSR